ncbi:hypothetical protein MUK42_01501 [Musa troglodytarum]|uniref:Uncharacterized protein n=1 Tax=Musa troglodytarum TaxID=320322 RepID=A0A9E7I2W5_9LILI|nr:hypothetical protein MUK42_01501 [Musa troglodytarum]
MFDPFAPGPEELVFAPKKKMLKGTQVPPRRQLNFNDCGDSNQQVLQGHALLHPGEKQQNQGRSGLEYAESLSSGPAGLDHGSSPDENYRLKPWSPVS